MTCFFKDKMSIFLMSYSEFFDCFFLAELEGVLCLLDGFEEFDLILDLEWALLALGLLF